MALPDIISAILAQVLVNRCQSLNCELKDWFLTERTKDDESYWLWVIRYWKKGIVIGYLLFVIRYLLKWFV
jgi:hypothetical protein